MSSEKPGYEKKDINLNKVFLTGVISIVLIVIIALFIFDYFSVVKEEIVYEQELKPESITLRELRARENEELAGYLCLDPKAERYRIPIERAMELIADESFTENK